MARLKKRKKEGKVDRPFDELEKGVTKSGVIEDTEASGRSEES